MAKIKIEWDDGSCSYMQVVKNSHINMGDRVGVTDDGLIEQYDGSYRIINGVKNIPIMATALEMHWAYEDCIYILDEFS